MSHYGKKVGDIVTNGLIPNKPQGEVVELTTNNNKIIVSCDGKMKEWVAEWCDVVVKAEDRGL